MIKIKNRLAVNLATALKSVSPNKDVGLLDADVFGPSIPLMMNLRETPLINNGNNHSLKIKTELDSKRKCDLCR